MRAIYLFTSYQHFEKAIKKPTISSELEFRPVAPVLPGSKMRNYLSSIVCDCSCDLSYIAL